MSSDAADRALHLQTLKSHADYAVSVYEDDVSEFQALKRELRELKHKVKKRKLHLKTSEKAMMESKSKLEEAEKQYGVIELDSESSASSEEERDSGQKEQGNVAEEEQEVVVWTTSRVQNVGLLYQEETEAQEEKTQNGEENDGKQHAAVEEAECPRSPSAKRQRTMHVTPESSALDAGLFSPSTTLRRSIGRTREWLNRNLDFGSDGCLFAKFSQGAFATKTENGIMKVSHVVLNDEWNELVTSQTLEQEFYVGTGTNKASFARALAKQTDAIALFHSPKRSEKTTEIFYVGHWASIYHKKFPTCSPVPFMGKDRQVLIRLRFVKYDEALDHAIAGHFVE